MAKQITLWQCPWCLNLFPKKEDCESHEKCCGYNPNGKKTIYEKNLNRGHDWDFPRVVW